MFCPINCYTIGKISEYICIFANDTHEFLSRITRPSRNLSPENLAVQSFRCVENMNMAHKEYIDVESSICTYTKCMRICSMHVVITASSTTFMLFWQKRNMLKCITQNRTLCRHAARSRLQITYPNYYTLLSFQYFQLDPS